MPILKLVALDLDGTIWEPDMYELWGGGGSPFVRHSIKSLKDKAGNKVSLLGISAQIIQNLKNSTTVIPAFVSTCDEPSWAFECLSLFETPDGDPFDMCAPKELQLVYKANSKRDHFGRIKQLYPLIEYNEMLFFDNQMNNIRDVSKLGVACVFCPEGLSRKSWVR